MVTAPTFAGTSVMESYAAVEKMLADVLMVVPYEKRHANVWSPALVTVLLEACSQLDSLWRFQIMNPAVGGTAPTGKIDMKTYFESFGQKIGTQWIVVWGGKGRLIRPFGVWNGLKGYTKSDYVPLNWWKAYNAVKHDRLAHRKMATLRRAIQAVSGLFMAIIACPFAKVDIHSAGWVGANPTPAGSLHLGVTAVLWSIESRLLSFLADIDRKNQTGELPVVSNGSKRFFFWCKDNLKEPNLLYP